MDACLVHVLAIGQTGDTDLSFEEQQNPPLTLRFIRNRLTFTQLSSFVLLLNWKNYEKLSGTSSTFQPHRNGSRTMRRR